jgi:flagellar basal-body rod modification protein FlgD
MQIAATGNATAAQATSSTASATTKTLDYNSFLQLLVAQLQHQDPTNPADPTAFVSQLASFSSVEQLVNANSKLDSLLTQTSLSQAASLIGRTISTGDGGVTGQIASVQVGSGGLTAVLADGQTVSLASGVKIS